MTIASILDTGSPISFVKKCYLPSMMIQPLNPSDSTGYCGINSSELHIVGKVVCIVNFKDNFVNSCMHVVEDFSNRHPIVLGRHFLRMSYVKLVIENKLKNIIENNICKNINENDKDNDNKNDKKI